MQKEEKEKEREERREKENRWGTNRKEQEKFETILLQYDHRRVNLAVFVLFRRAPPSRPGFHSRNVNTL